MFASCDKSHLKNTFWIASWKIGRFGNFWHATSLRNLTWMTVDLPISFLCCRCITLWSSGFFEDRLEMKSGQWKPVIKHWNLVCSTLSGRLLFVLVMGFVIAWSDRYCSYEGRSISMLQNSVILLVFEILKMQNLCFVGNLILNISCEFRYDDIIYLDL